ncbi:hypothetical protein G9A89_012229, partial [Geosiphon pyriformis]
MLQNKEAWDIRDHYRVLLYTLPIRTNVHNIWDFVKSVSKKTCVIDCHSVIYARIKCAVVCFNSAESLDAVIGTTLVLRGTNLCWSSLISTKCAKCGKLGHILLNCTENGKISFNSLLCRVLSDADKSRLAAIYAKQSALVARPVFFGGLFWAKVAGGFSFLPLFGQVVSLNIGFSLEMKPFLLVAMEINDRFAILEHSFASLTKHVDMLAKKLKAPEPMVSQLSLKYQLLVTPLSQNQEMNIVMSKSLGVVIGSKTVVEVVIFDFSVIEKIEDTLKNLVIMIMSLLAKMNNAGLKFATCNVQGLNISVKQEDIVCWHKEFRNM